MSIQALKTLHHICELEQTQLPIISAKSFRIPRLAGCLLIENRSNFRYVEGSTAWLYDDSQFFSPLFKADNCFDRIPIYYQDTVKSIDPITRPTFFYATPLSCDINPHIVIALELGTDEHYVLTFKPVLRATPMLSGPEQAQSAIRQDTFTAEEAEN